MQKSIFCLFLLFSLWSCNFPTKEEPEPPSPTVISTEPINGDADVDPKTLIVVSFSEKIDTSTIDIGFKILKEGLTENKEISFKNKTFEPQKMVTLESDLDYQSAYIVKINQNLKSTEGKKLYEPYKFTFTTADAPDTTRPYVRQMSPSPKEKNVPAGKEETIRVLFNEPMSIKKESIVLKYARDSTDFGVAGDYIFYFYDTTGIDIELTDNGKELLIFPDSLIANYKYFVTLDSNVTDLNGNRLKVRRWIEPKVSYRKGENSEAYEWYFETEKNRWMVPENFIVTQATKIPKREDGSYTGSKLYVSAWRYEPKKYDCQSYLIMFDRYGLIELKKGYTSYGSLSDNKNCVTAYNGRYDDYIFFYEGGGVQRKMTTSCKEEWNTFMASEIRFYNNYIYEPGVWKVNIENGETLAKVDKGWYKQTDIGFFNTETGYKVITFGYDDYDEKIPTVGKIDEQFRKFEGIVPFEDEDIVEANIISSPHNLIYMFRKPDSLKLWKITDKKLEFLWTKYLPFENIVTTSEDENGDLYFVNKDGSENLNLVKIQKDGNIVFDLEIGKSQIPEEIDIIWQLPEKIDINDLIYLPYGREIKRIDPMTGRFLKPTEFDF